MSKQANWTVARVKAELPRVPVVDASGERYMAVLSGSTLPEATMFLPGSRPGAPWTAPWRAVAAALNAGTRVAVATVAL